MSAPAEPDCPHPQTSWGTPLLIAITAAAGGLAVLFPDRDGAAVSVVWVGLALLALAGWLWRRSRWLSRVLLVVVTFGWARPLFAPLLPRRPDIEGDISSYLLGFGAAGHWRLSAAVLALVALVVSVAVARRRLVGPGLAAALAMILAIGLISGLAVAAGFGLDALNRRQLIGEVEQSTRFAPAEAAGATRVADVGQRPGWSRDGLYELRPAGDVVVGVEGIEVESGTLVRSVALLRGSDGALLWRWRLLARAPDAGIASVTVDRDRRTIAVQVGNALIGLDFSGQVRYRRALPELVGPRDRWLPVSDHLTQSRSVLQTGSVLVLAKNRVGSPSRFAEGFDVASGAELWQLDTPAPECSFAQATGRGAVSYLLVGGYTCPTTELSRWDGAVPSFTVRVRPPAAGRANAVNVGSDSPTPPDLSIVDSDRVAVTAFWLGVKGTDSEALSGRDSRVYDTAGSEIGQVPASVRRSVAYPPVPTTETPLGGLGVLLRDGIRGLSWMALSPQLKGVSGTQLAVGEPFPVVHRAGIDLIIYRPGRTGAGGAVSLLTAGPAPKVRETIQTAGLSSCGAGVDAVNGDESLLTLRCGSTGFVRPLS